MIIAPVITIDGPSGAGKGTLCKALTKILQWNYMDSGAIYRLLALIAIKNKVKITNEAALVQLTTHLNIRFEINQGELNIILNGKDVSQTIREESYGKTASQIAIFPHVRKALLQRQRIFRVSPGLIADGRDMGTVVFPDAPVKIFLDASSKERAYRRLQQLQKQGFNVNFRRVLLEIKERDNRDCNRAVAPLTTAADSLIIRSTHLTIDEVISKALMYAKQVLALS